MSKTHSRHRSGARPDRGRTKSTKEEVTKQGRPASASARRLAAAKKKFAPPGGEFIGRRVGRSSKDLGDVLRPIDPEERRAGTPSTARRNALANTRSTTHALEDSATGKPSRKSTRRAGETHVKSESNLRRRAVRRTHAPKTRAERAGATTKKSGRARVT